MYAAQNFHFFRHFVIVIHAKKTGRERIHDPHIQFQIYLAADQELR